MNCIQRVLAKLLGLDERSYAMLILEKEARSILKALDGPSVPFHKDKHKLCENSAAEQYETDEPVTVYNFNGLTWIIFKRAGGKIDKLKLEPSWFNGLLETMSNHQANQSNLNPLLDFTSLSQTRH